LLKFGQVLVDLLFGKLALQGLNSLQRARGEGFAENRGRLQQNYSVDTLYQFLFVVL
jgi:hypothetical protein